MHVDENDHRQTNQTSRDPTGETDRPVVGSTKLVPMCDDMIIARILCAARSRVNRFLHHP